MGSESEQSTIAGMRVDRQQEVALILKGSSLVAEAAGRQQVSRTSRSLRSGSRKSKPGRSGGLLESVFDKLVERASRERKRGFKSE